MPTKRLNELPKRAESNFYRGCFYGTTETRICFIVAGIMEGWTRHRPDIVLIEEYAFSRHSTSLSPLHELGGVIKHYLTVADALWLPLVRDAALLYGSGKAKASKEESVEAAVQHGFAACPNGDIADAFHHARYGFRKFAQLVESVT